MPKIKHIALAFFVALFLSTLIAGEAPKTLTAWLGSTPIVDGILEEGEWADAEFFDGVADWQSDTAPASRDKDDLSVKAWVKHDGTSLYFAFDVLDDVLYGFDIDRWVHSNNPNANDMNSKGWPWWGDGVEIMMNSTYTWNSTGGCAGDGRSWQVVTSTHKSTMHGLEQGGLMAGEPRTTAWDTYAEWASNGDMQAAVRLKDKSEGRGYVIEWRINPNPCMQINASTFVDLSRESKVGLNFEIQDLDEKEKGDGNWSNMHHIDYWTKVGSSGKTDLRSFGTLVIKPDKKSTAVRNEESQIMDYELLQNYPNPFNPSTTIRYHLPSSSGVQLAIYSSKGQLVRSLVNAEKKEGLHSIVWDGLDNSGDEAASGVYFCQLRTSDFSQTRKLLLME
jgi:hypothetical protein